MARIARVVIPGLPHHVTQRGNRRQPVFFTKEDRQTYLRLLKKQSERLGVQFWAYCLMDNHVHFIAVPEQESSLARTFGGAHRRYSLMINQREGWTGYLWQGRFASFPLDESHLVAAVRYVERNPVAAGLVRKAEEYPWSSAKAHVMKTRDPILTDRFLTDQIQDWSAFLQEEDGAIVGQIEHHVRTGRPMGDEGFLTRLEQQTGRRLKKQRAGRKMGNEYSVPLLDSEKGK